MLYNILKEGSASYYIKFYALKPNSWIIFTSLKLKIVLTFNKVF
jgi:hypothetical protein